MPDKICFKSEHGIKEYLIDLLFPNRCAFCGGFISYDRLCCDKCFDEVLWADKYICLKCGKVRESCLCNEKLKYDMCIPAAYYEGSGGECVRNLKFSKMLNGAEIFGRILRDRLDALDITPEIDVCIPVPMSVRNQRKRGYNQAQMISQHIIKGTEIKLENKCIFRKNAAVSQHELNAEQRRTAAKEQYYADDSISLKGKTVLLVDDVLTTGSTLNSCAALIKDKLHADKIICAVCTTV